MLFPETEKVEYQKPTLTQVICELRFPTILKIESEIPTAFQEKIRKAYPLFEKKTGMPLGLPSGLPEGIAQALMGFNIEGGSPVFQFSSADGRWTAGLTNGSVSLSTRQYKRWGDFRNHLDLVLSSFVEVYSPAFFTRIGLRYMNLISPRQLGLSDVPWSELLTPQVTGILSDQRISRSVEGQEQKALLRLPDEAGMIRMSHGLVRLPGAVDASYSIDNDLYLESRTEVADVFQRFDVFKRISFELFRWCITDRLHIAMQPRPLSD
jgi:uncharacterized protein (TIGR04255 family)